MRKEGCKRFNVCNREEKKRDTHTKARIWKQTKKEGKNEINLVHLFPLHMSTAALINEDGKKKNDLKQRRRKNKRVDDKRGSAATAFFMRGKARQKKKETKRRKHTVDGRHSSFLSSELCVA